MQTSEQIKLKNGASVLWMIVYEDSGKRRGILTWSKRKVCASNVQLVGYGITLSLQRYDKEKQVWNDGMPF
jgi:hypothetical protein